ncbi:hypothetical protein F2X85_06685 [Staphylococcus aureus]|nr:hypothetical protein F2X85_06685 [Staphylococcus aureus]
MTERKCACNKLFSILVRGPNKEKLDSQFLQTMQVGVGRRNKFCENLISVPLPRTTIKQIIRGSLSFLWNSPPKIYNKIHL